MFVKHRIIIFGLGKSCEKLLKCINYNRVDVVCFTDNDEVKQGKEFCGKDVVSPTELLKINFDYIVIFSSYYKEITNQLIDMGIEEKKVISIYHLEFNPKIYDFLQCNKKYEGFVTGISYAECGIDTKYFSKSIFNFALSSEDLYYNYKTIKYLFKHFPYQVEKFKYAIITLSFYSFNYDYSLTKNFFNNIPTYLMFNDLHNFRDNGLIKKMNIDNKVLQQIFIEEKLEKIKLQGYRNNLSSIFSKTLSFHEFNKIIDDEDYINRMRKEFNKNYMQTETENRKVFDNYIRFVLQRNIKPIIVILPQPKNSMNRILHSDVKNKFYKTLNEFSTKYSFQVIDYFDSELFTYADFYDAAHLNSIGAKKFTQLLEEEIKW